MLTPEQIDELNTAAEQLTCPAVEYIIEQLVKGWTKAGRLTGEAAYQVWRLQQLGVTLPEIEKELQKKLGAAAVEAGSLTRRWLDVSWAADVERLTSYGIDSGKIERVGGDIRRIIQAAVTLTEGSMKDVTKTLGLIDRNGLWQPLRQVYLDGCDRVWTLSISGAESWLKAVQDESRNLWREGVKVVDYESGRRTTVDVAVRRALLSSLGSAQAEINKVMGDELGLDGMEITAHAASAPDHEPYQGRQFKRETYDLINAGLRRRISTLNCGHVAFPVLYGTPTQYTAEELEKMRTDNERGVEVDGKTYTQYEATQELRRLERQMRKQYRKGLTCQNSGDTEGLSQCKSRLTTMRAEYRRFARAAHLTPQLERVWVPDGRLEV